MAFEILKEKLTQGPVLKIFDQNLESELHTDASAVAYAAILMQKSNDDGSLHPVYYMSRKTTETEAKYKSNELEALEVIEGVKKFRKYLFGVKFKIVTDCQAFQLTLDKKDMSSSPRVARWIMLLQDYDFTVEHRHRSQMKHVDALSRNPYNVTKEVMITQDDMMLAQSKDASLKAIIEILKSGSYEGLKMDYCSREMRNCWLYPKAWKQS